MPSDVERGIALLRNHGCLNCHSTDGSLKIGPTFKDLWGRTHPVVTNGNPRDVVVDEAYLARSLREPDADIVSGFTAGTMPKMAASDEDVHAIALVLQSPDALRDAANQRARTIGSIAIAGGIFAVIFVLFTVIRSRRGDANKAASPP